MRSEGGKTKIIVVLVFGAVVVIGCTERYHNGRVLLLRDILLAKIQSPA